MQHPYLGSSFSKSGLARLERSRAVRVSRPSAKERLELAVDLLVGGAIIGWAHGRAELGPRALGHRAILADPRRPEMKARINAAVKLREVFRPFAPSILHEHGERWFEHYVEAPYMERALRFREEARDQVPAVLHTDGTGRLQSVTRERSPLFHALLTAFHERTGVPLS